MLQQAHSLQLMRVFNAHQPSLCSPLTFLQSKAVYHMGPSLLEFQPAILDAGEVLTICSEIKKIKEWISSGQHAFSRYERRNRTRATAFSLAAVPAKSQIATTPGTASCARNPAYKSRGCRCLRTQRTEQNSKNAPAIKIGVLGPSRRQCLIGLAGFWTERSRALQTIYVNSFVQRAHYLNFKMGRVMGLWFNLLPGNRTGVDEQMWYLMFCVPLS